jgi:hypothetical protein
LATISASSKPSAVCWAFPEERHARVKGKYITIENGDLLAQLAGQARNVA